MKLHCESLGEGPPLVILHGLYGSGTNWKSHARWLSEHRRVLLPDLRNHGRSPHVPGMAYPDMADDVVALLDAEDIERATIVGHSMGGKVAMALALAHPDRVRALVVVDIAPVTYPSRHEALIESLQRLQPGHLRSRGEADRELAAEIPEPMVRQFLLTNLERREEGYGWRIPLDILAAELPRLVGWPDIPGQWRGPALFVHGGASDYVTDGARAEIARYFPEARTLAVKGAGHWLHAEAPDAFRDVLQGFLDEQDPPP
ncbi:MAG: alpha/beta fold hydrolase [Ectothiorhodospiraceae bacterium]